MKNLFDRAKLFFSKDREFRSALYDIMGFCPHNIDLYRTAFAHKSQEYRSKKLGNKPLNNERLEFLGDAVLETVVSHIVYRHFPNKREGFLTNTRSKIVSRESLGKLAKELHIDRLIQSQTHSRTHNSYLGGNSFEALMGAIYLDRGFRYAFRFVEQRIIGAVLDLESVASKEVNFKSKLLEWSQKNRIRLEFKDSATDTDKANGPSFLTTIVIEGLYAGEGMGYSKKESHQTAAKDALTKLRREPQFLDSVFRAKEKRTRVMNDHDKAVTAYHEGGHALAAAALNYTDPVTKVTILPRGRALGYTMVMPTEDRFNKTRNQLLDDLVYGMGGRVAEEIVFRDPSTGPANDIQQATKTARAMVTDYGMSDRIGMVKLGDADTEAFGHGSGEAPRSFSDETAAIIDEEVRRLLDNAMREAWRILSENRGVLDTLASRLLEEETLDEAQLAEIFKDVVKAPERPVWNYQSDAAVPGALLGNPVGVGSAEASATPRTSVRARRSAGEEASHVSARSAVRFPSRKSSPAGLPVTAGSPKTPRSSSRSWKARPHGVRIVSRTSSRSAT